MNNTLMYKLSENELKELQKVLLEIYCDIAAVCQKYNLHIILGGGTCLGAVRHNGFIPWDDDMDLLMFRKEYNKLLEVFEDELGDKYYLVDLKKTHTGQKTYAKIMKRNTTYLEPCINENASPAGIFVDIFPLELLPDNYVFRSIFLYFANIFTKLIAVIIGYQISSTPHRIIGMLTSFMSVYKWNDLYTFFISSCNGKKFCFLPSGGHGVYAELLPFETMSPFSEGTFEGKKVFLPHDYDFYLKNLYGNYMEMPPVEKREGVHPVIDFNLKKGKEMQINKTKNAKEFLTYKDHHPTLNFHFRNRSKHKIKS